MADPIVSVSVPIAPGSTERRLASALKTMPARISIELNEIVKLTVAVRVAAGLSAPPCWRLRTTLVTFGIVELFEVEQFPCGSIDEATSRARQGNFD